MIIDTDKMAGLPLDELVNAINEARMALHEISPFKGEPVDFVRWVKSDSVHANDYNPNSVAPPEMKLLHTSIKNDGYTQPIVTAADNDGVVVIALEKSARTYMGKFMGICQLCKSGGARMGATIGLPPLFDITELEENMLFQP